MKKIKKRKIKMKEKNLSKVDVVKVQYRFGVPRRGLGRSAVAVSCAKGKKFALLLITLTFLMLHYTEHTICI